MASPKDSSNDSAIRNLDLTLSLEIPIQGPSDSSSSCPVFSLGPVKIPLGTCRPPGPISGTFTRDQMDSEIGNSLSPLTTGVPTTSTSG